MSIAGKANEMEQKIMVGMAKAFLSKIPGHYLPQLFTMFEAYELLLFQFLTNKIEDKQGINLIVSWINGELIVNPVQFILNKQGEQIPKQLPNGKFLNVTKFINNLSPEVTEKLLVLAMNNDNSSVSQTMELLEIEYQRQNSPFLNKAND